MHRQSRTAKRKCPARGTVVARRERERALGELARRQHGVLTRAQLVALGISPGAVDWRLKTGRLRALQRGVYLVGPVAPPLAAAMAAVLSCGEGAALSHRTAASLWRLLPPPVPPGDNELTVPGRDPGNRPGVRVHRVRDLRCDEIATFRGIPITTPARTAIDLAASASDRELEQALAQLLRRRLASRRHLLDLVARYPTRRGASRIKALAAAGGRPALTRSQAEERFLTLVRSADLPSPEVNVLLHGFEVDFLWRDQRLVVEVDGYAYHSDPHAFERDRRRDAELVAHGFRVVRVTWRQLVDAPAAVLARVAQALATGAR